MSELLIFSALFTIPLICIAYMFFESYSNRLKIHNRQREGLIYILELKKVLDFGQKHRGLTTGYLKGDSSLLTEISNVQEKLNSLFLELKFESDLGLAWRKIVDDWKILKSTYKNESVAVNFESHVIWITQVLNFIEEVAETQSLLSVETFSSYKHDFLWTDMLQAIEYMGQARALGTGVAASKEFNSIEKIRAQYLYNKISYAVEQLEGILELSDELKEKVRTFQKYLSIELHQTPIKVSSHEFFEIATQAIGLMYEHFEHAIQSIEI